MVTIMDYKILEKENGEQFFALEVQGGVEIVKSQDTGRNYLTARKATVPCTFNETICKSLIGQELPGCIVKVDVEEYEYEVPGTGEVITLTHRYEFVNEEDALLKSQMVDADEVVI